MAVEEICGENNVR